MLYFDRKYLDWKNLRYKSRSPGHKCNFNIYRDINASTPEPTNLRMSLWTSIISPDLIYSSSMETIRSPVTLTPNNLSTTIVKFTVYIPHNVARDVVGAGCGLQPQPPSSGIDPKPTCFDKHRRPSLRDKSLNQQRLRCGIAKVRIRIRLKAQR
jgi:hypothetical protein